MLTHWVGLLASVALIGFAVVSLVVVWRHLPPRPWNGFFARLFFVSLGAWVATGLWIDVGDRAASTSLWLVRLNAIGFRLALAALAALVVLLIARSHDRISRAEGTAPTEPRQPTP